jgi:Immunity protein 8
MRDKRRVVINTKESFVEIRHFYYLSSYPTELPPNPLVAVSEVRVEVADEESLNDFDYCYSIMVCTLEFIALQLQTQSWYGGRSLVIVRRFDDQTIKKALEEMLPQLEKMGVRIE